MKSDGAFFTTQMLFQIMSFALITRFYKNRAQINDFKTFKVLSKMFIKCMVLDRTKSSPENTSSLVFWGTYPSRPPKVDIIILKIKQINVENYLLIFLYIKLHHFIILTFGVLWRGNTPRTTRLKYFRETI